MALTPAQITTLRTELTNDPRAYGYAPLVAVGNDPAVADLLNLVRPTITVKRIDCTPVEILEAIDIRDFAATPTGVNNIPMVQSWLESVTQFSKLRLTADNGNKTLIRKNIDRLVNDTQGSQTRLDAIAVRIGSRAEELFGAGITVTPDEVSSAR